MADVSRFSDAAIEAAAAAIANARGARRGMPALSNILVVLRTNPRLSHLHDEVLEDAKAALLAADRFPDDRR